TFETTAILNFGLTSATAMAARSPAPPPPTRSTSWEDDSIVPPQPWLRNLPEKKLTRIYRLLCCLVKRRCGWGSITCPLPDQKGSEKRGRRRENRRPFWGDRRGDPSSSMRTWSWKACRPTLPSPPAEQLRSSGCCPRDIG